MIGFLNVFIKTPFITNKFQSIPFYRVISLLSADLLHFRVLWIQYI